MMSKKAAAHPAATELHQESAPAMQSTSPDASYRRWNENLNASMRH